MRERLEDSRRGATRWRERALSCDDEDKALECLRRSRQASAQAKGLEETSRRHNEAEQRLGRDIERVRARIEQLQQKRHLLRSREATAQAASGIQRLDDTLGLGLDDTFERWEARVMEAEFAAGTVCDKDSLQSEFVTTEERASLKAELEALKGRGVGDED